MVRLFVAAWPTPEVRARLDGLDRPERPGWRWVPPDNWHVTLRFLGELAPAGIDIVTDRLSGSDLPRVAARFGPGITMLDGRQAVIPVDGADALAAAVTAATVDVGEPPRPTFVGHLTVARRRGSPAANRGAIGPPAEASFDAVQTIDEIALVRSDLGPDGARYTTIARFPTDDVTT